MSFFLYSNVCFGLILSRMSKTGLGRGLGALLSGAQGTQSSPASGGVPKISPGGSTALDVAQAEILHPTQALEGQATLPLSKIRPCALQPRKHFDAVALEELAASIKERGLMQPLVVRPAGNEFELIAGERRWRASQIAGLNQVPVLIRQASDREVLELALIENLQREDLNPIEESSGYARLLGQFDLRQEDVASRVGKSRVHVANSLRLLKLSGDVQAHLREGRLSVGHAKVILALPSTEEQDLAAEKVIRDGLNVRQTETLVHAWTSGSSNQPARGPRVAIPGDPHLSRLENRLQEKFGTRVKLRYRAGKGTMEVKFFSDDELERILGIVGIQPE